MLIHTEKNTHQIMLWIERIISLRVCLKAPHCIYDGMKSTGTQKKCESLHTSTLCVRFCKNGCINQIL